MDALKNNEFTTVRKWIVNNSTMTRMFRLVYDLYDYLDGSTIPHAVIIIGDILQAVADQEINMLRV